MKHCRPAGKKKEGNDRRFTTRSQAIKKLQCGPAHSRLWIRDVIGHEEGCPAMAQKWEEPQIYRSLCIYKGIFPREPKKKVKGNGHNCYHQKDIAYLQHGPLVKEFRELSVHQMKIEKALEKKDKYRATRRETRQPITIYNGVILERYPNFVDALRDLNDCLTLVHLLAAVPPMERLKIGVECVRNCRRLSHEWQAYIARTHKLRKVCLSVKGIYYQVEVEGQTITWLTPHAMEPVLPGDVNYSDMLRLLEFYQNLLGCVNLRLYHTLNLVYPPIIDPQLKALAAGLYALSKYVGVHSSRSMEESKASSVTEQVRVNVEGTEVEEPEVRLAQLQYRHPSSEPGAPKRFVQYRHPSSEPGTPKRFVQYTANEDEYDQDTRDCKSLFRNMKIFLSREVPRESLIFVILAFGGVVSWDGDRAPFMEADQRITHQIVCRPTQGQKYLSRHYVQRQWIYDCVNARIILPADEYLVGRIPPPHLSPFVDNEAKDYVPECAETIKGLQAEVVPITGVEKEDIEDLTNLLAENYISRKEAAERKRKNEVLEKHCHKELEEDLQGLSSSSPSSKKSKDTEVKVSQLKIQQILENYVSLKLEMTRKYRNLKALKKHERKDARNNKLREPKKANEAEKSGEEI